MIKSTISYRCHDDHVEDFRQIFEAYYPRLLSYLKKRWGMSHQDAQDASQEALIYTWRVWRKSPRTQELDWKWVRRVSTNKAMDLFRKRNAKKNKPISILNIDDTKQCEALKQIPSPQLLPDDLLISQELLDTLLESIGQLRESYQKGLILYYVYGFTHREIALTLGISEDASKKVLERARKAFREKLGTDFIEQQIHVSGVRAVD